MMNLLGELASAVGSAPLNLKQHCCRTGKFRSIRRGGRRRFFRARECEAIKERESAKKNKCQKAKAPSANSRFFSHPQWKSGFRAQSRSGRGKQGS
jgi:hypothetical protein